MDAVTFTTRDVVAGLVATARSAYLPCQLRFMTFWFTWTSSPFRRACRRNIRHYNVDSTMRNAQRSTAAFNPPCTAQLPTTPRHCVHGGLTHRDRSSACLRVPCIHTNRDSALVRVCPYDVKFWLRSSRNAAHLVLDRAATAGLPRRPTLLAAMNLTPLLIRLFCPQHAQRTDYGNRTGWPDDVVDPLPVGRDNVCANAQPSSRAYAPVFVLPFYHFFTAPSIMAGTTAGLNLPLRFLPFRGTHADVWF